MIKRFSTLDVGVGTTKLAGAMTVERSLTPEARDIMQAGVEHAYRTFVGLI